MPSRAHGARRDGKASRCLLRPVLSFGQQRPPTANGRPSGFPIPPLAVRGLHEQRGETRVSHARRESLPWCPASPLSGRKIMSLRTLAHSTQIKPSPLGQLLLSSSRLTPVPFSHISCELLEVPIQLSEMVIGQINNRLIHKRIDMDILRRHQIHTIKYFNRIALIWI